MQLARLVAALFLLASADAGSKPKAAILLSQVQSLTLRGHGAQTTHRRVPSAPQLKCLSHPSLCALVEPHLDVMRCQNMGSSYDEANVEWSCTATLPDEVRLGSTDVICEGYASSDDEYVLKGSCGVEYRVALTEAGEERYPDLVNKMQQGVTGPSNMFGYLFCLLFVGIVCWMFYKAWTNTNPRMANRIRRRHGRAGGRLGGGGGGWGGDDDYGPGGGGGFGADSDAPPPYPGSSSRKSAPSGRQQQGEGWRPGFWTGLAAGGAAAYAARGSSSRNNNNNNNRRQGDGFFGGGGSSSSYASSSRSGPSGSAHESTGFGSTSRR
ncbi:Store-operated calcium entry-associated regulatory factor-like protein [Emericellopsis cladophorae]|uniref:Store-operated calcium entry-associated regulatory factor n=1 Tax=Emericellopsis cladophorae TaxID=2686198 RepID=A0A9Q0BET6_9HYPO|nr:Store-operated calcium entry-associated regulatory factor-like protein [Emericellopsis cladophorae]KAI6782211.1 Store-operated calcium entry-associated regulatory factor-like protein [Emericellopsis cladophorae]